MEEKEIDVRRRAHGTGAQYLMALIKCAEWVSKEYKVLADGNKENIEVVKELYLCACDGVPIEKAVAAMKKNPPEGALRFVRQKYMENIAMGDYKEELSGIRNKADVLERDVMQMSKKDVPKSGTLKNLRRMEFPWQRKESVPEFVRMLLDKGYSSEQIDFLLKCIEEGTDIKLVKKIASPKLPVDVLQRLLKMTEREEKTNGK